ncbi:uncharacterized protein VTP21DRAFT_2261 [Calcarisporiella thermophila]|uniref:uncharacterized protein n=1 Tax=Calcarisporiella thermophila TaxID=911321 RepID=UPI0037438489
MLGLKGTTLLYTVSLFASLGQWLFGYDQGVMAGILVNEDFLVKFDYPSETIQGLIVGVFELGCLVTSLLASWTMDKYGRRPTILLGSMVFIVGGAIQTGSENVATIIAGRIVAGLGVGFLSSCTTLYTAELSRAHNRGRVTVLGMSINMFGYTCSNFIDYGFSYVTNSWSWRGPLFFQCVFGLILALGSLVLPESPRHLVAKGKTEVACKVLADLYGCQDVKDARVQTEYAEIQEAVDYEKTLGEPSWKEMFTGYGKRSLIGIAIMGLNQLSGINIVTYYAPKMYVRVGWIGRQSILFAGFTALVYFFGGLFATLIVDRAGRRPLFMIGTLLMAAWLVLMGVFNKELNTIEPAPILMIVFTMIYVFTSSASLACIAWLYCPEIFPLRVRAKGMSLAVASNWIFNFAVAQFTPPMLVAIGWGTYIFYAVWNIIAFISIYLLFPETKGRTLEEMDEIFGTSNKSTKDINSDKQVV